MAQSKRVPRRADLQGTDEGRWGRAGAMQGAKLEGEGNHADERERWAGAVALEGLGSCGSAACSMVHVMARTEPV